jgi:hypothetical protein
MGQVPRRVNLAISSHNSHLSQLVNIQKISVCELPRVDSRIAFRFGVWDDSSRSEGKA